MSSDERLLDVLVVDDDEGFRRAVTRRLTAGGMNVEEAEEGERALEIAQRRRFHVAILDMVMPGMSGLDLLAKLRELTPDCEVVMLTGLGTIETAVEAMKRGAREFLTKPVKLATLEVAVQKAAETRNLRLENQQLKAAIERAKPDTKILGTSPQIREVLRLIEKAGPTSHAILIEGETGTGKELVARALQQASELADKPLVTINCATLPETLLESELFGHEKGAFTGAISAKPGLFEIADGGTLFIDEMGELPGALQAKLLRVLEDGSLRRVGSVQEHRVKVRIIAATNRDLHKEVEGGKFREDLYYRINVMCIEVPPLRERQGDVEILVDHFLGTDWKLDQHARGPLIRYAWPGNVRQLINAIERAKIMADGGEIYLEDFPSEIEASTETTEHLTASGVTDDDLATVERAKVIEVLQNEEGNKARAARRLGVSRRSLYRLIDRYNIGSEPSQPLTTN
ncbi:MAG: sigma-54-dependent Fis family transcriptional regulator [Planctomycetes bacterium]|nr:sigma-54-dependent Fis family transcriptional regulator [Planctomycetota bacterium]